MVLCVSCGTVAPDASHPCLKWGASLPRSGDNKSPGIDETIAIPAAQSARPLGASSKSGISFAPSIDEGRFLPGTLVAGRYRIIGLLGRGGMGEVYRATDLMLAQSVALKFLPEDAATNERLLERFHSEARIARQVSHPNVCRVYDIGEADSHPFISMEYIDGEDLAGLLQRIGRLPSDKALEITRKLCAGLAAAHERGVIHRDLKPQNIMLNKRGEVVIMDFGLAAVADALEGPEARNGTPGYMSPKQLRGDSVTAKSDIYALGLIIYELFTGRRAYDGATLVELMRAQETARPASIGSIASDVDPAVEKVVLRCLQPDPVQRPASALAVAAALPGGDPLAAALAAGETPSPELGAASGETEGFRLMYALPCLILVLVGLVAYPFFVQQNAMLPMTPADFPPSVLAQKVREATEQLGYAGKPTDWKYWLVPAR
jgi:predicted Ser/Thr protein kinase